jgi:hypothetical protein
MFVFLAILAGIICFALVGAVSYIFILIFPDIPGELALLLGLALMVGITTLGDKAIKRSEKKAYIKKLNDAGGAVYYKKVNSISNIKSKGNEVYIYEDRVSFNLIEYILKENILDVSYKTDTSTSFHGYGAARKLYSSVWETISIAYRSSSDSMNTRYISITDYQNEKGNITKAKYRKQRELYHHLCKLAGKELPKTADSTPPSEPYQL